jgi:hypothetical protein
VGGGARATAPGHTHILGVSTMTSDPGLHKPKSGTARTAIIYRYFVTILYFRINKHCLMMTSIDFEPMAIKIAVVLARTLPKTCDEITFMKIRLHLKRLYRPMSLHSIVVLKNLIAYTSCFK